MWSVDALSELKDPYKSLPEQMANTKLEEETRWLEEEKAEAEMENDR